MSYNVPPYGRAGLYLELANLKELIDEYRSGNQDDMEDDASREVREAIWSTAHRSGMLNDVPPLTMGSTNETEITSADLPQDIDIDVFDKWVVDLSDRLYVLQDRLFSSGLHVLGDPPRDEELKSYLNAYFGEKLTEEECEEVIQQWHKTKEGTNGEYSVLGGFFSFLNGLLGQSSAEAADGDEGQVDSSLQKDASEIVRLLSASTEEMDSILNALDGGYVPAKPGGDLLRDGSSVLPTGKNIFALDPYRMPSATAWARGQRAAEETLRQHKENNNGQYPETVAVTLWGLDAIKTR